MPPPTFEELIRDPKARDRLTLPQLQEFVNKLKGLTQGMGRPIGLPDNPADFAVELSGGEWKNAKHLEYISKKVQQLERQEIRRLMISLPPRNGKSYLLDRWTPVWWLSRHPKHTVILAGYGETFARLWGGAVRDLITENSSRLNLLIDKERTAADDWALTTGGGMICVGVGGALVGRGANLLIIDDPIKNAKEAASETYRESMWEWWQGTASTRLEPGGGVIMIATRWHQDDLLGRIEREDGKNWEIVKIPAIAEPDDAIGRAVGEPLWPERWKDDDPDYEVRKRTSGPYVWSAQFQCRPSPAGGGMFPRDDWQYYHNRNEIIQTCDQMIQSWDFAMSQRSSADYTVGQVWARKQADFYLVDQVRGHFDLAQIERHMKMFSFKYPKAVAKLVEDTALGPAIKQRLQHEVAGLIPVKTPGGSAATASTKLSRAQVMVPYLLGHNLYLPCEPDGGKQQWVWELIEEFAAFDKGANDDQVDAAGHAIGFMQPGGWRDLKRSLQEAFDKDPANVVTPAEIRKGWFSERMKKARERADKVFNPPRKGFRQW